MFCQGFYKLSIIIPTLNEEKNIERLLKSIQKQEFKNYEIIVADAGSDDKTLKIAKKYNCRIIKGGSPAKGRNSGASITKGNLLFFLDADVFLPPDFLPKILKEFKKKKVRTASFFLIPDSKSRLVKLSFNLFYNFPIFLLEKILPHGAMGILIEKELFKKIKGFNEDIKLAEDHDLIRRAAKLAKYGILKSAKIYVSDRRFKKDGWFRTYLKYLLCEFHMIFIGPVKKDIFQYDFDHLKADKK